MYQQDSVPAHRARDTHIELLRCTTQILPDMWPPNSSDINPADCAIWSVIQQRVYDTEFMTSMSCDSVYCMCSLEQSLIDNAVDQWPKRLRACVRARVRHFENVL